MSEIDRLLGRIDAEYDALIEKLPWWQIGLISAMVGLALLSYGAACGILTGATGGLAGPPCLVVAIALIGAIMTFVISIDAFHGEARALQAKSNRLDQLIQLELESEGGE